MLRYPNAYCYNLQALAKTVLKPLFVFWSACTAERCIKMTYPLGIRDVQLRPTPLTDICAVSKKLSRMSAKTPQTRKPPKGKGQRASRMRVNSHDVAAAAGVSPSAVSRAFTPGASVAPKKKAIILAAARKLGYRPNVMARAIAKGRSNVVGLIMFGETNRDHPAVLLELSRSFSAQHVRVMLFIIEHSDEIASVVDNILSYQLDGVIAAASIPPVDLATLGQAKVPVIFYNRPGTQICASVSCDHATAGRTIAKHLIDLGHRNFGLIHACDSYVGEERLRGVQSALDEAGACVTATAEGDFAYFEGFQAVERWLAAGFDNFTALIAANDSMAIGAHDALVINNKAKTIAIAGFDAVEASRWRSHPIISIRQPIEHMADAVAEMMKRQLDDETPLVEYRVFPGQLQISGAMEFVRFGRLAID